MEFTLTGSTNNYTATEGINTGTFTLAQFQYTNPGATVSNFEATLSIGGWGDATPATSGTVLTIIPTGGTNFYSEFAVVGSHTYINSSPPGIPYVLSVIITPIYGTPITLTSPPGGGVTVLDAPLSSSNGTVITGVEGSPTGNVIIGTFTDENQYATSDDYTTDGGSVVINWGDASAPETLTSSNLVAVGSPNGIIWQVIASHTYADEGTYAITTTVTDNDGSVTIFSSSAVIRDAPLVSTTQPTVCIIERTQLNGKIGAFIDTNPLGSVGDFTAMIDWGDGSPLTAGTISQHCGMGSTFFVSGIHTYVHHGNYNIQIFIVDTGGSRLTIFNQITVIRKCVEQPNCHRHHHHNHC